MCSCNNKDATYLTPGSYTCWQVAWDTREKSLKPVAEVTAIDQKSVKPGSANWQTPGQYQYRNCTVKLLISKARKIFGKKKDKKTIKEKAVIQLKLAQPSD